MKFNDWLIDEMKKRSWSQAELARRSGLTRSAISNYVSGQRPNSSAIDKLAKAFQLPPSVLFDISSTTRKTVNNTWADEMAYKLSLLDDARKSIAEKFIVALLGNGDDTDDLRK
jgi:transcriptional regulator with XRE-family HTH domain